MSRRYTCKRPPRDQPHAKVLLTFVLPNFVNGHDMRMVQPSRRFGFGVKTLLQCRGGQLSSQNHLEGDGPIQAYLPGPINYAHPSPGDLFEQNVIAEVANV